MRILSSDRVFAHLAMSCAVVIEGKYGMRRAVDTFVAAAIFVDVVAQVDHIVVVVLPSGVSVCIEVAVGYKAVSYCFFVDPCNVWL